MSDAVAPSLIDTSDMVRVHRVFREAFGSAAPLVGSVPSGDLDRAELVAAYYFNVLEMLRGHHEGEDEIVWPRLVERAPDRAETIRRIAGQHEGVHASLEEALARLAEWRREPDIDGGARLAATLATLGAELALHLDEEERVILPIAARHMSAQEWAQLPMHGMQHFSGDRIWLVMGLIQEQMTPEQVAAMREHMPPPVVEFWDTTGRPQFEEFMAALRH